MATVRACAFKESAKGVYAANFRLTIASVITQVGVGLGESPLKFPV